jgi:hypothetical protein
MAGVGDAINTEVQGHEVTGTITGIEQQSYIVKTERGDIEIPVEKFEKF